MFCMSLAAWLEHGGMSCHLYMVLAHIFSPIFQFTSHFWRDFFFLCFLAYILLFFTTFLTSLVLFLFRFFLIYISSSILMRLHLFHKYRYCTVHVQYIPLAFPPFSHLSSVLRFHLSYSSSYDLLFSYPSLSHTVYNFNTLSFLLAPISLVLFSFICICLISLLMFVFRYHISLNHVMFPFFNYIFYSTLQYLTFLFWSYLVFTF
jgi:hypothetical protein